MIDITIDNVIPTIVHRAVVYVKKKWQKMLQEQSVHWHHLHSPPRRLIIDTLQVISKTLHNLRRLCLLDGCHIQSYQYCLSRLHEYSSVGLEFGYVWVGCEGGDQRQLRYAPVS